MKDHAAHIAKPSSISKEPRSSGRRSAVTPMDTAGRMCSVLDNKESATQAKTRDKAICRAVETCTLDTADIKLIEESKLKIQQSSLKSRDSRMSEEAEESEKPEGGIDEDEDAAIAAESLLCFALADTAHKPRNGAYEDQYTTLKGNIAGKESEGDAIGKSLPVDDRSTSKVSYSQILSAHDDTPPVSPKTISSPIRKVRSPRIASMPKPVAAKRGRPRGKGTGTTRKPEIKYKRPACIACHKAHMGCRDRDHPDGCFECRTSTSRNEGCVPRQDGRTLRGNRRRAQKMSTPSPVRSHRGGSTGTMRSISISPPTKRRRLGSRTLPPCLPDAASRGNIRLPSLTEALRGVEVPVRKTSHHATAASRPTTPVDAPGEPATLNKGQDTGPKCESCGCGCSAQPKATR